MRYCPIWKSVRKLFFVRARGGKLLHMQMLLNEPPPLMGMVAGGSPFPAADWPGQDDRMYRHGNLGQSGLLLFDLHQKRCIFCRSPPEEAI